MRRYAVQNDKTALMQIAQVDYAELLKRLRKFRALFCAQWKTENKPQGFFPFT
ncbi:MAG: hypothetical protein HFE47_00475 [Clostridia bacterium]|jgi:hypothetical protein|nr:hypothetical protein [Clostridia bacterium]